MTKLLCVSALLLASCEAIEGHRFVLHKAEASLFVPSNWETQVTPADKDTDAATMEAHPRDVKGVQLRVFTKTIELTGLEDMVKQTLLDISRLEKQGGIKVLDVTQIELKRPGFIAARIVHQLQLGKGNATLAVTQYTDLLFRPGLGIVLFVGGPKQGVDEVAPEIERILSSVRNLVPEPDVERPQPPAYATMTFPRALQRVLLGR